MRSINRRPVQHSDRDKSRADDLACKLVCLRNATTSVEKLLFGAWATSPFHEMVDPPDPAKWVIQKDWHINSVQRRNCERIRLQLLRLTGFYEINCFELARILTCRGQSSRKSNLVQNAAWWAKNNVPIALLDPQQLENVRGKVALEKARRSGNLKFLQKVNENIRYNTRKTAGGIIINGKTVGQQRNGLKLTMTHWWAPIPKISWPGLAFCKASAQRDFLQLMGFKIPSPLERETARNKLYNLRDQTGLIPSEDRFISRIEDERGWLKFS